jgi:hypothetical protein
MTKFLDWLMPWRVTARELRQTRHELAATNRQLELLIQALETKVVRNLLA